MNVASEDRENFDAPWQAYAYAMVHVLVDAGLFSRSEWTIALGEALRAGPTDDGAAYYEAFLKTLEGLVVGKGVALASELATVKERWRHAYETTPHGKSLELDRS